MRNRRLPGRELATLALVLGTVVALGGSAATAPGTASVEATAATDRPGGTRPGGTGPVPSTEGATGPVPTGLNPARPGGLGGAGHRRAGSPGPGAGPGPGNAALGTSSPTSTGAGDAATVGAGVWLNVPGAACGGFAGARQLAGDDGVAPAAWSGGGLVVPACGPVPGGGPAAAVYPYPGALWTAGYQCVELSERYLYERYGVAMGIATNGDQVVAHYAAGYPGLFMVVRNGTPHRPPAAGDVLSLSAAPGFDSASGGHTAVVQSSSVDAAGDGTVTVVEENAAASGVAVLPVNGWSVRYPGFRYVEWLTTAGLTVTSPHPPPPRAGRRYFFALTATGGAPPYRWSAPPGALPPGLGLSPTGVLAGTVTAVPAWPVPVAVTDARGATATAALSLTVP
ncbi:MAG TPA: putative Ig domain-containing protein [Trebonia sp.]